MKKSVAIIFVLAFLALLYSCNGLINNESVEKATFEKAPFPIISGGAPCVSWIIAAAR